MDVPARSCPNSHAAIFRDLVTEEIALSFWSPYGFMLAKQLAFRCLILVAHTCRLLHEFLGIASLNFTKLEKVLIWQSSIAALVVQTCKLIWSRFTSRSRQASLYCVLVRVVLPWDITIMRLFKASRQIKVCRTSCSYWCWVRGYCPSSTIPWSTCYGQDIPLCWCGSHHGVDLISFSFLFNLIKTDLSKLGEIILSESILRTEHDFYYLQYCIFLFELATDILLFSDKSCSHLGYVLYDPSAPYAESIHPLGRPLHVYTKGGYYIYHAQYFVILLKMSVLYLFRTLQDITYLKYVQPVFFQSKLWCVNDIIPE